MTSATRFCARASPAINGTRRSAHSAAIGTVSLLDIPAPPLPGSEIVRWSRQAIRDSTDDSTTPYQLRKQLTCFVLRARELAHSFCNIAAQRANLRPAQSLSLENRTVQGWRPQHGRFARIHAGRRAR